MSSLLEQVFPKSRSHPPSIGILMPTSGSVNPITMNDLCDLISYSERHGLPCKVYSNIGSNLCIQREELLRSSINAHTHVLWVDSDMSFPASSLSRLIGLNLPIVGANYSKKMVGPMRGSTALTQIGDQNSAVTTFEDSSGTVRVRGIGFGLLLMRTRSLRAILRLANVNGRMMFPIANLNEGEDAGFCRLCEETGVEIHLDHDLSHSVYHLGTVAYGNHDAKPMTGSL